MTRDAFASTVLVGTFIALCVILLGGPLVELALGYGLLHSWRGHINPSYLAGLVRAGEIVDQSYFIPETLMALCISAASLTLMFLLSAAGHRSPTDDKGLGPLLWIVLNGTMIRLVLSYACYGNFDIDSWRLGAEIAARGGNVYVETYRYMYSPVWFVLLGWLKKLEAGFPALTLNFLIGAFLTLVDLATLCLILWICRLRKLSMPKSALFFYLNPITFLLTGYHRQFENLAILCLISGIAGFIRLGEGSSAGKAILWLSATMGMIAKHSIFYEVIICLKVAFRSNRVRLALLAASSGMFLATFIPYWPTGSRQIIDHVFKYCAHEGAYGVTSLIFMPHLKNLFVLSLCIFPIFLKARTSSKTA